MSFLLLLAVLQGQAQHHGKRHARHTAGMPDSVSTTDEELHPFDASSLDSAAPDRPAGVKDQPVQDQTAAAPDAEEKEPPLVLRSVPDSVIDRRKKERDFAYANDPSWWKDDARHERNDQSGAFVRLLDSKGFRYFIYFFLAAVLLFALYKIIAENNLRLFYRRPVRVRETSSGDAALPEEDLDRLLKKALDEGAHRMAVRYLYLKTLRVLEAHQLLRLHIQTTDEEYARQLDQLPQGESFRRLMAAYERVWYGKFSLNDQQFSRLLQYFQDFYTSLEHISRA